MTKARLRKVGGSVMLAIPPALLELTRLKANMEVGLTVSEDSLVVRSTRSRKRRKYSLADLIAKGDAAHASGDHEWVDAPAVGDELL